MKQAARPEGLEPSTDRVRRSRKCGCLGDRWLRGDTGREIRKWIQIAFKFDSNSRLQEHELRAAV